MTLVFEDRLCPLCGSSANSRLFAEARFDPSRLDAMSFSSRKAPEGMHHRLLECTGCDLLYASPVPTPESINDAYRDAGYSSGEEARYAAATYATLVERIEAELPDLRGAVDIGAGDGAFLHRLLAAGFDRTVGFEPSHAPRAAAAADVRPLIRPEPFVAGVLPDEAFTLVSCLQTIEHVLDPLALCRDAARVARALGCDADRVPRSARAQRAHSQASLADLRHRARAALLREECRRSPPARQGSNASRCSRSETAIRCGTGFSSRRFAGGLKAALRGVPRGRSARRQADEPWRRESSFAIAYKPAA